MAVSPSSTGQSSTTEAAIEHRIALTRDMQAELGAIWETARPWKASISIFLTAELYDSVPTPAAPHPSGHFCTKELATVCGPDFASCITLYCPGGESTSHRCPPGETDGAS